MGGATKNPKINKRGRGGLLFGTGEYFVRRLVFQRESFLRSKFKHFISDIIADYGAALPEALH